MHECKVTLKQGVIQVVVVVVNLRRTKLTLVDDVVGRQRTDVKVIIESDLVSGMFSQDVELSREVRRVERPLFFRVIRVPSIVVRENDERL